MNPRWPVIHILKREALNITNTVPLFGCIDFVIHSTSQTCSRPVSPVAGRDFS